MYAGLQCVDTQEGSWKDSIILTVVLDCLSLEHVLVLRSAICIDDYVGIYDLSILIASWWLGQSLSTDYLGREGEEEGGGGGRERREGEERGRGERERERGRGSERMRGGGEEEGGRRERRRGGKEVGRKERSVRQG